VVTDVVPADPLSLDAAEVALCAVIRGTPRIWRDLGDPSAQAVFLAAVRRHRLRPLIAWLLRERGELASWPAALAEALVKSERAEAALEIVRAVELGRLLRSFAAAGVEAILFKGAALAYSLYPEPWLRPREDTDVIIRFADLPEAGRVLVDAGFEPMSMTAGGIVTHQRTYVRNDRSGRRHEWDLHWKIANPVAFADLLSAGELLDGSVPIALGGDAIARVPRPVHALVLCCLHRVSHHHDSGNLLWLYDIHLLAERLALDEVGELVDVCRRIGAGAICARGLRLARERFETRLPESILGDLEAPVDGTPALPAAYLGTDAGKARLLAADLAATAGWRRRLVLIREHLFPPADYMLSCYSRSSRPLLPALYAWRIVRGARGWFRPPERDDPS
jgi:Uncharacterised nucleotidyltransferase